MYKYRCKIIISEQHLTMSNIYHIQVKFIPGMKGWFNIRIFIILINSPHDHIKRAQIILCNNKC